jgi:guanylate kinase
MSRGLLIVLSGPSGAGKGTVLREVVKKDDNIVVSVSSTTRKPREGEVDGVNYHFLTKQQFEEKIKNNELLEYVKYVDNYYGTTWQTVNEMLKKGKDVVLEIEVIGANKVKMLHPECLMLFVAPPSIDELYERLINRGSEDKESLQKRIATALDEFGFINKYDYVILNDDVNRAADEILEIIKIYRKMKNNTV